MKTSHLLLVLAPLVGLLAGCAQTAASLRDAGHEPLDATQLKRAFSGAETEWRIPGAVAGTARYGSDGTATVNWGEGDHRGRWRVRNDRLCTRYEGVRDGAERCYTVFRIEDEYRYFVDGELHATAEMVADN